MESVHLFPSLPQIFRLTLSPIKSGGMVNSRKESLQRFSMTDFDIDVETGFIPRKPLPHLQEPFDIWEAALAEAPEVLGLGDDESEMGIEWREGSLAWRKIVGSWPTLDVALLHGHRRRLQRAHMVLAWLVNFFVHSTPPSDGPTHVPRSLAVPLVQVSRILGMAPVLTFADTVLWNWELIDPEKPTTYENVRITNSFSDTDDERNFYAVSVRAELEGAEVLQIIENYHNAQNISDSATISKISGDLIRLVGLIDFLNEVIQSVRECCDPRVFYRDIRPWLEGSDSKSPGDRKWIYEGIDNSASLDLSGPSGGQSSIMHALDIFLGVDYKSRIGRSGETPGQKKIVGGFMERMTRYMPGKHREYLSCIAAMPGSIRELTIRTPTLREPYNLAVRALKRLREKHMRIAFLYIVTMSKSFPTKPTCPMGLSPQAKRGSPVLGTGGNDIAILLKGCRDATRGALLKDY